LLKGILEIFLKVAMMELMQRAVNCVMIHSLRRLCRPYLTSSCSKGPPGLVQPRDACIIGRSSYNATRSENVSLLSQSRNVVRPFALQFARVADNSSVWGPKLRAWGGPTCQFPRLPPQQLYSRSRPALLFKCMPIVHLGLI
jgi:hypothetical protein